MEFHRNLIVLFGTDTLSGLGVTELRKSFTRGGGYLPGEQRHTAGVSWLFILTLAMFFLSLSKEWPVPHLVFVATLIHPRYSCRREPNAINVFVAQRKKKRAEPCVGTTRSFQLRPFQRWQSFRCGDIEVEKSALVGRGVLKGYCGKLTGRN